MSEKLAVVALGPTWWGDGTLDRDGQSSLTWKDAPRRARYAEAQREVDGIDDAVAGLPEDCYVLHTGARGAAMRFAHAASARGLTMMVVPPEVVDDVVLGLITQKWKVKMLLASATNTVDDPLAAVLKSQRVWVTFVPPAPEPEPEPVEPAGS